MRLEVTRSQEMFEFEIDGEPYVLTVKTHPTIEYTIQREQGGWIPITVSLTEFEYKGETITCGKVEMRYHSEGLGSSVCLFYAPTGERIYLK